MPTCFQPPGFNPRARMGRDPCRIPCGTRPTCFNPRARMGRDEFVSRTSIWDKSFNPRARMGRDPHQPRIAAVIIVSIHAPAWGATAVAKEAGWPTIVSIHAPAWGATVVIACIISMSSVSIHAPAWGATENWFNDFGSAPCFNPRARMGRDGWRKGLRTEGAVSIHAPAWGATHEASADPAMDEFQSTRPHGARQVPDAFAPTLILFQSTRPHGARPGAGLASFTGSCCFNPRARMGRDGYRSLSAP